MNGFMKWLSENKCRWFGHSWGPWKLHGYSGENEEIQEWKRSCNRHKEVTQQMRCVTAEQYKEKRNYYFLLGVFPLPKEFEKC